MTHDPLDDAVSRQYQRWVYPEPIEDLPGWLEDNWQWFDPRHAAPMLWPDGGAPDDLDILIAGCGANQAAVFAFTNPKARVVGIDVSRASLDHEERLKDTYSLSNLELHRMPVEATGDLGRDFDLIVSTGVLHHMADPEAGLAALAGCLKQNGVVALMLYARYGRVGVEMLQATFRDMGLQQDEASLDVVKRTLAGLPPSHPVHAYLEIAPDLRFDAGLVDTFLHGRDRSYTVAECLQLVRASGLVFVDWFLKAPYYPVMGADDPRRSRVEALPLEQQWAMMETINTRNACHFFTACRPDRPASGYVIDFASAGYADYVPSLRYRCALRDGEIARSDWSTALGAEQLALAARIDGSATIGEIVAATGTGEEFGREFFESLWRLDFAAMAITAGS